MQDLAEAHSGRPELFLNLGDTLREMDRLEDAAGSYGRAIALTPNDYQGYQNLGIVRIDQDEHQNAIEPFA